jgi:hypothetical protein
MLNKRDLILKARSRYTGTFKEDKVFDHIIETMLSYLEESQGVAYDLVDGLFDIEKSQGKMLDLIGKIVNQERVLVSYNTNRNFGFFGHPLAESFGTVDDPSVGGVWKSLSNNNAQFRVLTDEEYRTVILARIVSNNSGGTTDDLLEVTNILTGNTTARVDTNINGEALLVVEDSNLDFLQYFYTRIGNPDSLLPIPLGVNLKIEVI